jgi:alkanesulfonate monooxygenase SsuD/methylene tetrahydromethanopterin reductase-like flavin-dependent oxidoreductase (luciferase family)
MWEAWKAGDRKAATEAIPEHLIEQLIINGTPEECREHVERYVAAGLHTPVLAVVPTPDVDLREVTRALAPTS